MAQETKVATFGAGCFWHVEAAFAALDGVVSTQVGYMGGNVPNPTYEMVCSDRTGHAEVVHVEYDPEQISYDQLLEVYWDLHDPTSLNRQGPDVGTQYRSVIFFHDAEQERAARAAVRELEASGRYHRPIVTEIVAAGPFYRAEEYHQQYFARHFGLSPQQAALACGIGSPVMRHAKKGS
jgi:peptide-methionine (S)-S-oxide reductase